MNILIPMAGLATRFVNEGITTPKPLIQVNGKTLIEHAIETLGVTGRYIFVTRQYDDPVYNQTLSALLTRLAPDSVEVRLEAPTRGAVATCLAAMHFIDNDESLIVTNCDQRTEWDAAAFMMHIHASEIDGTIVTHESHDAKHSYAQVDANGYVMTVREKSVISNDALVGIHYYKHGYDFVSAAHKLIQNLAPDKECYVSETYNYLIADGRKITVFRVGKNEYIPLGTPYDVVLYEAKIKEFATVKSQTLFIDLDGTILRHLHRFSDINTTTPELLPGVLNQINHWDSIGHRIILCTARKESAREMTEQHLRALGLCWDQLVMGLSSGPRVLINDKLTNAAPDRAVAVNLLTNQGFNAISWHKLGL